MQDTPLFLGIGGHVVALDRASGKEIWRTKLKGNDFVNVVLDDGALYASNKGEVFCLDPATGTVRWNNRLSGLGLGLITMAGAGKSQPIVAAEKKRRDDAAAAAAATSTAI